MKKRYLLAFLTLCVFSYSCNVSVRRDYYIEIFDENNTEINTENELKEFDVIFFDNSNTKAYKGVDLMLSKSSSSCRYTLFFQVGHGHQQYQAVNLSNRFDDASEYMGIKIEDKKGRYKPVTIYPLSACSRIQGFEPIVVKLEKK